MDIQAETQISYGFENNCGSTNRIALRNDNQRSSVAYDEFFPLPELIDQEISIVLQMCLSDELQQWVHAYARVGHRNLYLWNWCHRAVEVATLSCVPADMRDELCDTKVLGVMLDVLLDDVADEGGNPAFLEHLLSLLSGRPNTEAAQFTPDEQAYAVFTAEIWNEVQRRVRRYPFFAEYAELLKFDYLQLFNTMRYAYLLNGNPALLNLTEHDLYLPHNMHIIICSTMDLMCSPHFDREELGLLREAMWKAQYMGRVGNLVTTWQRELKEGDITSGVFAHAVCHGEVKARDLLAPDGENIERVIQNGDHEAYFLRRWQKYRRDLITMRGNIKSIDLEALVRGFERLICLHLGSRGHK